MALPERAVRAERTGWRDQEISARHRVWGFNCPAVDLDFLMVEYNLGKPVGLIEYKHHQAWEPNLKHPTYRALTELAELAALPFLIAFYWPDVWAFRITPVNGLAQSHFQDGEILTERAFVTRLYRMRALVIRDAVLLQLNDELPVDPFAGLVF